MAKKKPAPVVATTTAPAVVPDDDLYNQMMGPAFRYAEFELGENGTSIAHVGPTDLPTKLVDQRFDFYRTYEPTLLRKFVVMDCRSAPPKPLVYGVCTDETEPADLEESLEERLFITTQNAASTIIFWEDY